MYFDPGPMQSLDYDAARLRQGRYGHEMLADERGFYYRVRHGYVVPKHFVQVPPEFTQPGREVAWLELDRTYVDQEPALVQDCKAGDA